MRYRQPDGRIYRGRGYNDIVRRMAEEKPEEIHSLTTYRAQAAARAKDLFGVEIDPTSNKSFLDDLVAAQLLERL